MGDWFSIRIPDECAYLLYDSGPITGPDETLIFSQYNLGLQSRDEIVSINEHPVNNMTWQDWRDQWARIQAGTQLNAPTSLSVDVTIRRGGTLYKIPIPKSGEPEVRQGLMSRNASFRCGVPGSGRKTRIDIYLADTNQVTEVAVRRDGSDWERISRRDAEVLALSLATNGLPVVSAGEIVPELGWHIITGVELFLPMTPQDEKVPLFGGLQYSGYAVSGGVAHRHKYGRATLSGQIGLRNLPFFFFPPGLGALFFRPVAGARFSYNVEVTDRILVGPFGQYSMWWDPTINSNEKSDHFDGALGAGLEFSVRPVRGEDETQMRIGWMRGISLEEDDPEKDFLLVSFGGQLSPRIWKSKSQ